MKKIIPAALITAAGAVVIGLIGMQAPALAEEAVKRDDDAIELVLADDDDGDDTNDDSTDAEDTSTPSLATSDNTNSRVSAVSRDRDISRGDMTKDFTSDGPGDQVRDLSANATNDNSRSDTRS